MKRHHEDFAVTLISPKGEKWILSPAPDDVDELFAWLDKTKAPRALRTLLFLKLVLFTKAPPAGKSSSVTLNGWTLASVGIK